MTIQRVPQVPFAQIANAALRDRRLSFKARGILALVLSNVGEWEATVKWVETMSDKDGIDSIRSGLRELTDLGYRVVKKERDEDGNIRSVAYWFHEPSSVDSLMEEKYTSRITRTMENPTVGKPDGRETHTSIEHDLKEHHLKEHQQKNTIDLSKTYRRHNYSQEFENFWSAYPRKQAKQAAWKAWRQAVRAAAAADIIAGACRYRDDPNRADEFTAHAATWLNHGRWDDEPLPVKTSGKKTGGQVRMDAYAEMFDSLRSEGRRLEA